MSDQVIIEKKPRKPRARILYYIVTKNGKPCNLALHSIVDPKGVLIPTDGQGLRFMRDEGSKNPLGRPQREASRAIKRTLNHAKKIKGSLADGIPSVQPLLAAGELIITPVKGIPQTTEEIGL